MADSVAVRESARVAVLLVMERLSPAERVAFVLHDAFGMSFTRIGAVVGRTPVGNSLRERVVAFFAAGASGHGAYPWLGDNALVKLVNTMTRLLARYPVANEEVWRTTVNFAGMDTLKSGL
jgi:hypothetical protein